MNCGLDALQGIKSLKNVSMYTLIHLAKDNGLNLFFCKVEEKDLPLVSRPAIFHSKDHFTLIEDGKPIPSGNYSGYVLASKPFGAPMPYSLAKDIRGGKKGRKILGPILTGVASIVNPYLGLAVGAGFGYANAKDNGQSRLLGTLVGGSLGYLGGAQGQLIKGVSNAALAGGIAAGGALPQAIKTGNYLGPVLAGAGGYLGQKFTSTAAGGFNAPASSFGERLGNTVGAFTGGKANAASMASGSPVNAGASSALKPGVLSGSTPTGYSGSLTIPGVSNSVHPSAINSLAGSSVLSAGNVASGGSSMFGNLKNSLSGIFNSTATGQPGVAGPTGGSGIESIFSKGNLIKGGLALAAGQIGKPPEYNPDSMAGFDKASQYLGGKTLPPATSAQLNRWISSPIKDIQAELISPQATSRAMLELDKKYQEALTQVQRAAANSGQSIETSSDARTQYNEINRQWAEAKANLQGELEQKALTEAIGIKQWSLQQSIAQGQFDTNAAMELAAMMGRDQELKAAIEQQNYDAFQDVVGDILSGNFGSSSGTTNKLPSEMVGAG